MDYAIYRGDEFLFVGNKKECAEYLGVKTETITFLATPTNLKRTVNYDKRLLVIKIKENEEEEEE